MSRNFRRGYSTQNKVYINKTIPKENEAKTAFITSSLVKATKELTWGELRLWIYLNLQKNGDFIWLSPSNIKDFIGLAETTYRDARAGLQKKGYIREIDKENHWWEFTDEPYFTEEQLQEQYIAKEKEYMESKK